MHYVLLICGDETAMLNAPADASKKMYASYVAYTDAMQQAGVLLGSNRLRPTSEAKTVRARAGAPTLTDGPFIETKEQLGGYFLIDVPDLETALSSARRCPGVTNGSIEVRPIWVM